MINKILNYYLSHKKLFIFVVFILLGSFVLYFILNLQPKLEIKVTPDESKIFVTSEEKAFTADTNFNKRIKKGLYNIKIEKSGYITEERQILLDRNTLLEINIFPSSLSEIQKSYVKENISPIFSVDGFKENKAFGINRINGNLIKIEDGEQTIIYSGKVKDYDVKNNTAIVIDEVNLNEINIVNLENLNIRKLNLQSLSPITSVSLSDDATKIFFLGEFKIEDKISSLNIVPINGGQPTNVVNTAAQSIEYLKDNIVILFTENHEENKNSFVLYDIDRKKTLLSKFTNNYNVSPDKSNVLLHRTNSIEIVDTSTFKSKNRDILESSRSVWKDNNLVYLFRNDSGNVYISKIIINPFDVGSFILLLENKALLNVFGFSEDKLFAQDYENEIFSINIPAI